MVPPTVGGSSHLNYIIKIIPKRHVLRPISQVILDFVMLINNTTVSTRDRKVVTIRATRRKSRDLNQRLALSHVLLTACSVQRDHRNKGKLGNTPSSGCHVSVSGRTSSFIGRQWETVQGAWRRTDRCAGGWSQLHWVLPTVCCDWTAVRGIGYSSKLLWGPAMVSFLQHDAEPSLEAPTWSNMHFRQ